MLLIKNKNFVCITSEDINVADKQIEIEGDGATLIINIQDANKATFVKIKQNSEHVIKFGEYLLITSTIDYQTLEEALKIQKRQKNKKIGEIISLHFQKINEQELQEKLEMFEKVNEALKNLIEAADLKNGF